MATFLDNLDWRCAEKAFDPAKKVSDSDLAKILHAIKMSPSSFGMQPYHFYVVSDQATKMKLKEKGYNQQQFEDASHVIVFCGRDDLKDRVNTYFEMASGGDATKRAAMKGYEDMMTGFAEGKQGEAAMSWAHRQAYIAFGFAMAACAELMIDSCPMEGLDTAAFDQILNVPANTKTVAALTIGYRKDVPHMPKVRFTDEDLFTKI